ncbi:hypothetical protein NA56DRAFT_674966 [Hyaloscypha hepaticicola]|uniref:Uncharacterized protein n=1 Tax=Hyaloscypha hepaticicola TaxID=2082293 RepID=A0A2J6PGN2_9HELO|nr:hypothetical protein NA56DRAFT_674966 [Hyaloscypha hepaticicola]
MKSIIHDVVMGQFDLKSSPFQRCDTLYTLGLAALNLSELCLALEQRLLPQLGIYSRIYSGDLVSHNSQNQVSRAYLEYTETSAYDISKSCIKNPVFFSCQVPWESNSAGTRIMSRPSERIMDGSMKQQQTSPRSIMLRTLDKINTISDSLPSTHTFGTNQTITMSFIDSTHRYVSRTFKFMIKEFQASEDAGERVWITGAVLSGWDGSYPLMNPTNFSTARTDWPSATPLTSLNFGVRLYEVDTGNFDIYGA